VGIELGADGIDGLAEKLFRHVVHRHEHGEHGTRRELGPLAPERWIGGASGLGTLDDSELPLAADHPEWPRARHPKLLWGEFGGSGGQLLAAALLEPSRQTLVTSPSSGGPQVALLLEDVVG